MVGIGHIFIAIASPVFVCCFLIEEEERRHLISLLAGFAVALFAGYINSFVAALLQMTAGAAVQNLTPILEELLKMLPILFFAEAFAKSKKEIVIASLEIGLGFAILENCSYLVAYGAESLAFSVVRGLATGVLHPLCALTAGVGICFVYRRRKYAIISFFGYLCAAMMIHGTFNLLMEAEDRRYRFWGSLIPLMLVGACILSVKIYKKKKGDNV